MENIYSPAKIAEFRSTQTPYYFRKYVSMAVLSGVLVINGIGNVYSYHSFMNSHPEIVKVRNQIHDLEGRLNSVVALKDIDLETLESTKKYKDQVAALKQSSAYLAYVDYDKTNGINNNVSGLFLFFGGINLLDCLRKLSDRKRNKKKLELVASSL